MAAPASSYTGNPGDSGKDQVRFLTGDTDATDWLLNDEEIGWLLVEHLRRVHSGWRSHRRQVRACRFHGEHL